MWTAHKATDYGTDVQYTQRQGVMHTLALDYQDDALDINDLGFLSRNDMMGGRYNLWLVRSDLPWLRRLSSGVTVGRWVNGEGLAVASRRKHPQLAHFPQPQSAPHDGVNWNAPQWDDLESRGHGAYP